MADVVSRPRRLRRQFWSAEARLGYAFVLPVLVLFVLFRLGPALAGFLLSFMDYKVMGGSRFVGLSNFQRLFQDPVFWGALRVTLVYTLISVPLITLVALAMALLVNQPVRFKTLFRSSLFLPYVTSLVMAGIIWSWLYQPDGALNSVLGALGLPGVNWLDNELTVIPAIAVMAVWKSFGYAMMVLLSGLLAIPRDYHEAAELDGAGPWRRLLGITLPLLKPALFFVLVIETIQAFQVFDAIYVMTSGGPVRASYSITYMLYDQGFKYFNFGYASAIGIVVFVIILALSVVQRRLVGREDT